MNAIRRFILALIGSLIYVRSIDNENAMINTFRTNQGLPKESWMMTYARDQLELSHRTDQNKVDE